MIPISESTPPKYLGKKCWCIIYCKLINMARKNATPINYDSIAEIMGKSPSERMGNHWPRKTGHLLGEICDFEHSNGRPMLSALVVNKTGKNKGLPGVGFFKLARHLGKLKPDSEKDEKPFWEQEMQAVYDAWKEITPFHQGE
jgi:hypothetical protein